MSGSEEEQALEFIKQHPEEAEEYAKENPDVADDVKTLKDVADDGAEENATGAEN